MKHERINIHPGDLIRCPDRATARWHTVARVGRRLNLDWHAVADLEIWP